MFSMFPSFASWLLLIYLGTFASAATTSSNIDALQSLYNSTDGPRWNWNNLPGMEWVFNSTSDPCQDNWQGVRCDACVDGSLCNVTRLFLTNYSLRGSLPSSICNLRNISNITLNSNYLHSDLPACVLSELPHLRSINLAFNNFSGTLPAQNISTHLNLRHLEFSSNQFSGTIPSLFGMLNHLTLLAMTANRLSGSFPTFIGSNMPILRSLELADNMLGGTIPSSYFLTVPNLLNLRLGGNPLHGSLATTICAITGLSNLYLNGSDFSGQLPSCLLNGQLNSLYIDNNMFSGPLPHRLSASLYELSAQNNRMTGTLPEALGNMSQATLISLGLNCFSGSVPSTLGSLSSLQILVLTSNMLDGTIPANIFVLPKVYILNFSKNRFNGRCKCDDDTV
jgi:hypothetical protein